MIRKLQAGRTWKWRTKIRAQRYIFSLKLANKLKTEFKRKVQAHNKKRTAILNSIFPKNEVKWREEPTNEKDENKSLIFLLIFF